MTAATQEKTDIFRTSIKTEIKSDNFERFLNIVEHTFPLEFLIAGELAQLETFAIPSISKLLHRTAQYEEAGVKRLDDTKATLYGIFLSPAGSEERTKMTDHLNWIHSHYDIDNDDNIYTLLRMFCHPIEWVEKWGWRKPSKLEIDSMYTELLLVGEAMNVHDFPQNYEEGQAWQKHYRLSNERSHPANKAVVNGTIQAIQAHFSPILRPLVPMLIVAFLDDEKLIANLGLKPPNRFQKGLAKGLIHTWNFIQRTLKPWSKKPFSSSWLANYYPSYNNKLVCCELGPKKLIQHRNKATGCPFH